jgi:hypothetical protein
MTVVMEDDGAVWAQLEDATEEAFDLGRATVAEDQIDESSFRSRGRHVGDCKRRRCRR